MSNCPNCNAILSYEGGLHCDYCGAWFEEPDWSEWETFYCNGVPYIRFNVRTGESLACGHAEVRCAAHG